MAVLRVRLKEVSNRSGTVFVALAWSILVVMALYFMYQNRSLQLDDALIYARYIDNALSGHGLVYNDGVRFNGLTSPLFSYIVLAVAFLTGDALMAGLLVSGLSFLMAAIVLALIVRDIAREHGFPMPGLAAWCVAALFLFMPYFYLTYGMETGLFTLVSALLIWLMYRRNYEMAGVCAALLFLTRSEGAFLILVVGLNDLMSHRRLPPFRFLTYVAPILLVAASLGFNAIYYDTALPETGMAKIWQGQSGLWANGGSFLDYGYLFDWVAKGNTSVVVMLFSAALIGFVVLGVSYLNRVVVAYLLLFGAFYVGFQIPNYHWYYSPFFVFLCLYAGFGFAWLAGWIAGRLADLPRSLTAAVSLLPMAWLLIFAAPINSVERGGFIPYRDIGIDLRERMRDGESAAMVEIGTVGYYSKRDIVDILGLVNPENARFIGERRFDAWLDVYQPDYLLVHEPLWDHELSLIEAGSRWALEEQCDLGQPLYRLFQVNTGGVRGIHSCPGKSAYVPGINAPIDSSLSPNGLGHVDAARVSGNYLVLDGWLRSPNGGAYEALGFAGPSATAVIWQRLPRQDVADHFSEPELAGAGFKVIVRFEDHEQALAAHERGCLLVAAPSGAVALPLGKDADCRSQAMPGSG